MDSYFIIDDNDNIQECTLEMYNSEYAFLTRKDNGQEIKVPWWELFETLKDAKAYMT